MEKFPLVEVVPHDQLYAGFHRIQILEGQNYPHHIWSAMCGVTMHDTVIQMSIETCVS